jgi:hypothetical protein
VFCRQHAGRRRIFSYDGRMQCPHCKKRIVDEEPVFCPRCGRLLEATEEGGDEPTPDAEDLRGNVRPPPPQQRSSHQPERPVPAPPSLGRPQVAAQPGPAAPEIDLDEMEEHARPPSPLSPPPRARPGELLVDMTTAIRRSLSSGGWTAAAWPALLGFLVLIAFGALFVGVVKLAEAGFGAGRSPWWALTRIVVAGLAALGVPLQHALTESSIVPLGVLLAVGWVIAAGARKVVTGGPSVSIRERTINGAKVGVPFGLFCFFASLIFRSAEGVEISANPIVAFLLGAFWAGLFGAVGGAMAGSSPQAAARDGIAAVRSRSSVLYEGVAAGATMLAAAAVLSMASALILIIVDLGLSADVPLTAGDAVAIVFLLIVFAPNIAVGVTGFAVGAPVEVVQQTFGGGFTGDVSLLGLGTATPEWYLYLLLLIPLAATLFGGYAARRRASDPGRVVDVICTAAGVFAVVLAALVFIGTVDIDRALLGRGNLLAISPRPAIVLVLSFIWAAALGFAGWKAAESQLLSEEDRSGSAEGPEVSANERSA